jgi:hypothetical protein
MQLRHLAMLGLLLVWACPAQAQKAGKVSSEKPMTLEEMGLPHYVAPPAYREELVLHGKEGDFTMKRFYDHGKIRSEFETKGQTFVMIEVGDKDGTSYMLMPDDKRAMKQSRASSEEAMAKMGHKVPERKQDEGAGPPAGPKAEDLGVDKVDGVAARKVRMHSEGADVVGWFDPTTGAPLRMESTQNGERTAIEWKDRKVEPQPAALFTVPKGYDLTDMDEMMKKMGSMGGGMPGMGGMAKGMAGGMAQNMGSTMGSSLGGTLGGALGGPLGSVAGQFIGGKIGGFLGKKAANAIN